jgi:ABC-type bacteriocin/lantibiotic exporter with double-glycine peptidase domain
MSKPTERVFWLMLESVIKHKSLITLALISNIIGAIFEGVSLALFAVAISVLTGDLNNSILVKLSEWTDFIFGLSIISLDKDILFFALIVSAIISQLIKAGFHFAGVVLTIRIRTFAIGDMQGRTIKHIMSFSLSEVNKYPGGELNNYVGLSSSITSFLLVVNGMVSKVLMVVSYLYVMYSISMPLMLVSLMVGSLLILSVSKMFESLKKYGKEVTQAGVKLGKEMMEFLSYPKFLRTYGKENYATGVIVRQIEKGLSARRKGEVLRAIIHPAFESISSIFAALLLIGGYFVIIDTSDSSPMPTLLAFILVFRRLMTSLSDLNGDRASIANMMPQAELVAEVLRVDNKEFTSRVGVEIKSINSGIELKNVEYSYQGAKGASLSNLNLSIPVGSVIGIVGRSGSGKTTLVDIILGLYQPSSGEVLIDDVSSIEALPVSWRHQFGVVSQDGAIFNRSIKANLALVNPDATDEEIINASKIAYAHKFILETEDGYDTIVGDKGNKLSGGQIQRLALARALLSKAKILVLDEATSALDSLSEHKIIEAVKRLGDDYTIIQIAHRLSTIVHADTIIVMQEGKIIEKGKHDELLTQGGQYYNMWKQQTKGV